MTSTYVPGLGYIVRDWRGRVIGKELTASQRDALLNRKDSGSIPGHLLPVFSA